MKKLINGQIVDMTAEEISARQAEEKEWNDGVFDRAMENLRDKRNNLLKQSDWTVLPDSPIADKTAWQTYRTELRDLTNGLTTVEQVEAVTWPTKPGA
jgi:hypothetical protein